MQDPYLALSKDAVLVVRKITISTPWKSYARVDALQRESVVQRCNHLVIAHAERLGFLKRRAFGHGRRCNCFGDGGGHSGGS